MRRPWRWVLPCCFGIFGIQGTVGCLSGCWRAFLPAPLLPCPPLLLLLLPPSCPPLLLPLLPPSPTDHPRHPAGRHYPQGLRGAQDALLSGGPGLGRTVWRPAHHLHGEALCCAALSGRGGAGQGGAAGLLGQRRLGCVQSNGCSSAAHLPAVCTCRPCPDGGLKLLT